jgi:hypothetical protein
MCAVVRVCVQQYTWQCGAVRLGVCGGACCSVRLSSSARGSVRQCAAVRADLCGSIIIIIIIIIM